MDESLTYGLGAGEEEVTEDETGIQLATVGAVTSDGITLIFDGTDEASEKEYKCNAGVLFAPGDRVKVTKDSGTYIVEYVIGAPAARYPLPPGGSSGQVLAKSSADNYAVSWQTPHYVPSGGTSGQVLAKSSDDNYAIGWVTPHYLPSGGSQGQVLAKSAATDYSTGWVDVHQIPSGGTKDQVLAKTSATNYEVAWVSPPHDLPTGGTAGQVLTKVNNTNYNVQWSDAPHELPTGGTDGQYLVKNGNTNYSVKWASAPATSKLTSGSNTVTYDSSALYPSNTCSLGSSQHYFNGCYIQGAIRLGSSYGSTLGFFGTTPTSKKTLTSSSTLANVISALQGYGLG